MIVGFIVYRHHDKLMSYYDTEIKIYSTPVKALVAYFKDTMNDTFELALQKRNNNVREALTDCLYSIRERGGVNTPPESSVCTELMALVEFDDGSTLNVIPVHVE